jgi:hypothetical protein
MHADMLADLGISYFVAQIQMHIVQKKIPRWSGKWLFLQGLNIFCWLISIVSAIGSVEGIYADTRNYTPFQTSYRR